MYTLTEIAKIISNGTKSNYFELPKEYLTLENLRIVEIFTGITINDSKEKGLKNDYIVGQNNSKE